jgi:hypothetical protein
MFIKLTEVVENSTTTRLAADVDHKKRFTLREVSINPEYVVCVREDNVIKQMLTEGYLPEGLDRRQRFTRVYLDRGQTGIDIVVVGDPETIQEDLKRVKGDKEILHG